MEPWLGVWNASMPGSKCIQYDHESYKILGDEDCLYLNVYTPKVSDVFVVYFFNISYAIKKFQLPDGQEKTKPLNVLVFIHGGAFMFLEGSYFRPGFILDKDIILVTLNYRLGPIGNYRHDDNGHVFSNDYT